MKQNQKFNKSNTTIMKSRHLIIVVIIGMVMAVQCEKTPEPEPTGVNIVPGMIVYGNLSISISVYNTSRLGVTASETMIIASDFRKNTRWGSHGVVAGLDYQTLAEVTSSTALGLSKTNSIKAAITEDRMFPAARWATTYHPAALNHKEFWLPTVAEFNSLVVANLTVLNAMLKKMDMQELSGWYWTSDLASDTEAWAVNVDTKEVKKFDRGEYLSVLPIAKIPAKGANILSTDERVPNPDPPKQSQIFLDLAMRVYSTKEGIWSASREPLQDPNLTLVGIALGAPFTGAVIRTVEGKFAYGPTVSLNLDEWPQTVVQTYDPYMPLQLQDKVYERLKNSPSVNYARRFGDGTWAICIAANYLYIQWNHQVLDAVLAEESLPPLLMGPDLFEAYWTNHTNFDYTWAWDSGKMGDFGDIWATARSSQLNIILVTFPPRGWNGGE